MLRNRHYASKVSMLKNRPYGSKVAMLKGRVSTVY